MQFTSICLAFPGGLNGVLDPILGARMGTTIRLDLGVSSGADPEQCREEGYGAQSSDNSKEEAGAAAPTPTPTPPTNSAL